MPAKSAHIVLRLATLLLIAVAASQAGAQSSDCASNTNASVADSTACSVGLLHDMLHRNTNYHIDAASVEAVSAFLAPYTSRVMGDTGVLLTDDPSYGSRIGFAQYQGEPAFIMPVFHRHYSMVSGGVYKCRGNLLITPTRIVFESSANSDGFSFLRSDLSEAHYMIERGDDGNRIIKLKAMKQTFIFAPDCSDHAAHRPCSYKRPFVLFDSAVQDFNVFSSAFAEQLGKAQ